MFLLPNLCSACLWYKHDESGFNTGVRRCDAFPEGIPFDILQGASHWQPFSDGSDNGISFEPAAETEGLIATYLAFWFDFDDDLTDTPAVDEVDSRPSRG